MPIYDSLGRHDVSASRAKAQDLFMLHFVRVAERTRGTNNNPVREIKAENDKRRSLAVILRMLQDDELDWPCWELHRSDGHRWFLDRLRQRAALIDELKAEHLKYSWGFTPDEEGWEKSTADDRYCALLREQIAREY